MSLQEAWHSDKMETIRQLAQKRVAEGPSCARCKYQHACNGGCRADAYVRFGRFDAPDPGCAALIDSPARQLIRDYDTTATGCA